MLFLESPAVGWVATTAFVHRLQNGPCERQAINAAGFAIDDFAFRADEHGVGRPWDR